MSLLSIGDDAKTVKGEKYGVLTGILYLAPGTLAGGADMCPHASAGCRASCLYSAGHGNMRSVTQARIRKTRLLFEDREAFYGILREDIRVLRNRAQKQGKVPAVRLNGTSDYPFEISGTMELFEDVKFYDYTKDFGRMELYLKGGMPGNYHLTFSRTEANEGQVAAVLKMGGNVAVVFSGTLPSHYLGYPVIDGDESDIRFYAPSSTVIGLKAKGRARQDLSGFVVQVAGFKAAAA